MKNEKDVYRARAEISPDFNYYFDKFTSLFVKSKRHKITNPKKILFIRNDHIGDLVYSTQVFREVKKRFPKAKIGVVATESNREIIEKDPYVDEIFEIDLFWRRKFKGLLDYFKVLKEIKKAKYDVGIDLRRSKLNIFFFLWIPRIKSRISFYNINGGKAFLTHPIEYKEKMNYIYENIRMVNEALGLDIKDKDCLPHVITDAEDRKKVNEVLKEKKLDKYVVFAPGATEDAKKWPEEKFDELIEKFHKKYPKYKVVLPGAPSDVDLINRLCKDRDFCVPLPNFNLRLMSIVHKKAAAVVANDGCAIDISWVSGGNLVALVGPVDLELYRFLGKTQILHHDTDCYPCFWANQCPKPKKEWCMNLITVDEVMNAINKFMKKR